MTDRLHSCKESPDGRHRPSEHSGWFCRYCCRTFDYLRDMGWNAPRHDPDALSDATGWRDEEADVNDAAHRWATRVMNEATKP